VIVAEHIEQWRPEAMCNLLRPITVPSVHIFWILGRIKPAKLLVFVEFLC
jgi:hypothetical protein